MAAKLLLALGVGVFWQPVLALDPAVYISQYHKQYWQVEHGLPHSYVYSIGHDPDGYLLIGTAEGLVRFDGLHFRVFRVGDPLQLSQKWISSLLSSRDGSLWIGTFDGALYEIAEGQVRSHHDLGGSIFQLAEDSDAILWASTRNGVFRRAGHGFVRQPELGPPLEMSWNVLHSDATGKLWVVTAEGLFERKKRGFMRRLANGGAIGDILTVCRARDGALWVGTSRGVYRMTDGDISLPLIRGPFVALLQDRDGVLWAGSWGKGLFRVHQDRVDQWSSARDLPDDFIRTLFEDREGNLWIGLRSGGVGRWRESRILNFGVPEGLAGDYGSVVAQGHEGSLWLGTWRGGLYRFSGGVMQPQPLPSPAFYFSISSLAVDLRGRLWLGNWEGLFESSLGGFRQHGARSGAPLRSINAILFDRTGGLWIGTDDKGVYRFPKGRPSDPAPAPLLPGQGITSLLEASAGTIWIGTKEGLYRCETPTKPPEAALGLPSTRVYSVTEDTRGRIWAAAFGMLWLVSSGKVFVFDRKHGLPEQPLYRVVEDRRGNLWVSSPGGLLEIDADSVEQVLAGRRQDLLFEIHGREDGMRTAVLHGVSQPAGARGPDGSLWFPTVRGFVRILPEMRQKMPPPRSRIEEVTVDGRSAASMTRVDLGPDARNISIRYTALRFSTPGKVRFRYRLTGMHQDWVEAAHERIARFNELPPGVHEFQVQARDPWGPWGEVASIKLTQEPRFSQTLWFYLLVGSIAVALAASLFRWRILSVRSRYAAILEERNRIGREWHDTLVAGFSAISLQLEAALTALNGNPQRANEILEVTRRMVHYYRAEARRVIWDLRDSRPEHESLPSALNETLRRATESHGIQGSLVVEGRPAELPAELQHNVLRICQEAISNAVRHARPNTIEVKLIYSSGALRAIVKDDGCGFREPLNELDAAGHFGLTVMRERARRHGGSLRVASSPGRGTSVEAEIPLNHSI
jgi:signal transduction histidine kinase/ligand-binding sensor domain-containing protein